MGGFSKAFNAMVKQLEQQSLDMAKEIRRIAQNTSLYETLADQIEQRMIAVNTDTSELLLVSHDSDATLLEEDNNSELSQWLKKQIEFMKDKKDIIPDRACSDGGKYHPPLLCVYPSSVLEPE
ncbi:MAG: hypothetical protein QM793_05300 [Muricomes sp.]